MPLPSQDHSVTATPTDSPTDWVADHIRRYVATDGREGHPVGGVPSLLITTIGRKTGKARRTALNFGRDGDRYLVVASVGGAPKDPAWYLNLVANPGVTVQVGAEVFQARAETATGAEKARLWTIMNEVWTYDEYQAKTTRDIPLVVLTRVSPAA